MSRTDPTFQVAFLFHDDIDLLTRILPRSLAAFTAGTRESFEVVLHCDGTPPDVFAQLPRLATEWGVDELRWHRRHRHVASGDPSNNGHRRLFTTRSPYLIVLEADVVAYRTETTFDPLHATRQLFERHRDVPVLSTVADSWQWAWRLTDLGAPVEAGVRSTNRLSTHFIAYAMDRFVPAATSFGAFDLDVFIDREDLSYNWEDLVSHVATTGGRRIAFADGWPLNVYHCDRKIVPASMHHTRDRSVRLGVLDELEAKYAPSGVTA
ncbi:MAG: hypothetical protein JWN54_3640 [Mycobacterium sp.]|nr:hypothetical protein [Mycobacterium sp.]